MKLNAKIVKCDKPSGSELKYSDSGFLRELQILNDENQVIWKSGGHHPESDITVGFNGFEFMAPAGRRDVYVKLEDGISFNR